MPYSSIFIHNYLRTCPYLTISLRQPKPTLLSPPPSSLHLRRRFHFSPKTTTLLHPQQPPPSRLFHPVRRPRLSSAFAVSCSAASSGRSTLVFKQQSDAYFPNFYNQSSWYGRLAYDEYASEDSDGEIEPRQLCASTLDNIEEWKWKLTMLMRDKDEQEVVSRERKDRRDFDQLSAMATRMGLYSRQYSKVIVISKVPLPNYRSDLDDKRPQREVVLPLGLQREVDAHLRGYISGKSVNKENFSDHTFSRSSSSSSLVSDEGVQEQEEPVIRNSIAAEKILQRKSLQLRNRQQHWQESPEGQKMVEFRRSLPAYKARDALLNSISQNQVVVVSGETGCGKTTQLPQYILESEIEAARGAACSIICTQPRRISAMSVAERVAAERGENLGESVGYKVRLEGMKGRDTCLLFFTTSILLRRLLVDRNLQGITHVIVDEIHERGMNEGTVFAYGVTSSGKTHTMHGDQNSPGIIPLAIKDVFSIIQDTPGQEFLLRVSYLEIYNEVINDLLDPTGQNLRVREDAQGTYVEGIKEEVVLSPGHALSFIAAGEEHRHVGSNNFNLFSSRSHTIFTLMIESSAHGDEYDGVVFSQLNLIDLAGSESSKTETTGLRRKEGAYINRSLLTLGTVIGKLSEGKASHVPYRDSKLTRLLQSSLSGHGHVSLICTITPASSNMEETHNTLKFASRAKCVEIFASRNKIIDEKSLIKKYQREISSLKLELDQLKKGILVGVSHEEVISLRQQLEEGQVKMQSRLEEEEEAKAALMSRIQRLTKLILVSTKNTIPGCLNDVPNHQRRHSVGEDDKLDVLRDGSFLIGSENHKEFSSSALAISSDPSNEFKHTRSSNKWNDELSPAGSTVTESTQGGIAMSDQMDLLVEQVKMLGGEIAFSTSTLKRLVEQSVTDPVSSKTQIQNLEHEIQEKRRQMRVLEQRIMESGEASTANGSLIDMQQKVMKLMTQCNEKSFELEITSADNRILQEQLQNKCAENKELQERINLLDQQLASGSGGKSSSSEQCISEEYVDELRKKIKSQEIENEKLQLEHVHILEKNSGLHVQNQKLSEEASYAKELASAAAVELKNLAGEVTKLSLHNAKLEKELLAAQELAHSRGAGLQTGSGGNRKYSDSIRPGRKGRLSGRANEVSRMVYSELDSWDLDPDDLKMELQARKQREAALEAALAEKDFVEEEYRKRAEEAKKRETALENDLANMWVLVAQLKKEGGAIPELSTNERQTDGINHVNDPKIDDVDSKNNVLKERQVTDVTKPAQDVSKEESLVLRLKARLQEMKEKELKYSANGDANSHVCKICFETPTATMLLPCRHFCLCESCSLACSECPICRTKITDRIFAFTP